MLHWIKQKWQKHRTKDLGLCSILCVLSVSLASGCAGAPQTELCLVDGDDSRRALDCAKEGVGEYSRTVEAADGYICLSRSDAEKYFEACRARRAVTVDFCQISAADVRLYCASIKTGEEVFYDLSWSDAVGFVCTSIIDFRRYISWCQR